MHFQLTKYILGKLVHPNAESDARNVNNKGWTNSHNFLCILRILTCLQSIYNWTEKEVPKECGHNLPSLNGVSVLGFRFPIKVHGSGSLVLKDVFVRISFLFC